jgi:UDP-N-acetylglucosamine/UDP-N-acetylgalactosamine diphosphorylase
MIDYSDRNDGPNANLSQTQISRSPTLNAQSAAELIPEKLLELLKNEKQEDIVEHLTTLSVEAQSKLMSRLSQINWSEFHQIYQAPELSHVEAAQVIALEQRQIDRSSIEAIGIAAYQKGEVAVLLVAGGEGSRLGLSGPKGCFPFGPISQDSMYKKHAEKVLAISKNTGHDVPFVLMTSPSTHEPTVSFFAEQEFFGLKPSQVRFFQQDTVPTTDLTGKLLLKAPGELLENPNGHGGSIDGLFNSGTLDWLNQQGIKDLVYLQVDNVLAPAYDTYAIGLRRQNNSDMINKVIKKISPEEKVGALVQVDKKDSIIEYSDLSEEQKTMKTSDNTLLFGWGNVAAHVVSIEFITKLQHDNYTLPFHQAKKVVEAWNGEDRSKIDGIKRERFFFDILALGNNIGLEISREQEFAPLKNATGADSIESSRILASNEHKRWLKECGIDVADHVTVEIRPAFAATVDELKSRIDKDLSLRSLNKNQDKILL